MGPNESIYVTKYMGKLSSYLDQVEKIKIINKNQLWWHIPIIALLWEAEVERSWGWPRLGNLAISCLKKKKK